MPKFVRLNVEDHRLLDGTTMVEDVTTVGLPTIEHPTTSVKAAGMVMDVDIPNMYHFNAMEFEISHNNGTNCNLLATPGNHSLEFRVARDIYDSTKGETDLELVKVRVHGAHKSTEKGDIETGNPYGSTEKYSVLRYEEEIRGVVTTLIDSMAGIIKINGVDFSSKLKSLLE